MNLHEYQAKQLFANYGMPVSKGHVIENIEQIPAVLAKLGPAPWVVKVQIHAGGRGKAGGVKVLSEESAVIDFAKKFLGQRVVTFQTDAHGQPVHQILIENCTDIAKELYLSAVVDRSQRRIVVMASTEGGVDIETVAEHTPEKILKEVIDPIVGPLPYQARCMAFKLGLQDHQIKEFTDIFMGLVKLFIEKDLSLVEINPLVITTAGHLHCLDGKINVDTNAMFRHSELQALRDVSQEDPREQRAADFEINYVPLEGDIGCMVNGAGLAMATMDLIKLHGGRPANFLDVGGGANKERVTEAFKIILSDTNVKAILVNIFGGIVRCDMIAEGIMAAVSDVGVQVPVVVRLEGTNSKLGAQKLAESGLNIIAAAGFTDAAKKVVEAAAK